MAAVTDLLGPKKNPLKRLSMSRLQLNKDNPVCSMTGHGEEFLIYLMMGRVEYNGPDLEITNTPILDNPRKVVQENCLRVLRFPGGHPWEIHLKLLSASADMLIVGCEIPADMPTANVRPVVQMGCDTHDVAIEDPNCRRQVRVLPTPAGYNIECGETFSGQSTFQDSSGRIVNLNYGSWSSWPAHANQEDRKRFAEGKTQHEEIMFFVCPEKGLALLNGVYNNNILAMQKPLLIENGSAHVMPLGSHPICAPPGGWIWYFWAYTGNALTKTYNQWSTDVKTYVK